MNNKNKKFEENYFRGWFRNAVGDFSGHDLEISRNWFWGWLQKLQQYVDITDGHGKTALEIGCSIGGVASLLADRGYKVYASDVSQYAIARAKKLSPQISFFIYDVQKNINPARQYDLIIAFEVVEHLEKPFLALQNMVKLLKSNGTLVISTPYPYPWIYSDQTHINVKYPHEWIACMKKAGLMRVERHEFSLLPYFYKFHHIFHIIFPFALPFSFINNPIYFIGKKK